MNRTVSGSAYGSAYTYGGRLQELESTLQEDRTLQVLLVQSNGRYIIWLVWLRREVAFEVRISGSSVPRCHPASTTSKSPSNLPRF